MEHEDIDIVACNDPFIEPHYAVSHIQKLEKRTGQLHKQRERCSKLR
jgi:hypothetical protein